MYIHTFGKNQLLIMHYKKAIHKYITYIGDDCENTRLNDNKLIF